MCNRIMFSHFLVAAHVASSSFVTKWTGRKAATALLLMRQHNYGNQYWVHPVNTKREEHGEHHTLYKDLRNYPNQFYIYYHMTTQSFDYILMHSWDHIYKPKLNFWPSICSEEKLGCLYQVPCYRGFHYHHYLQLQLRKMNCLEHHTW